LSAACNSVVRMSRQHNAGQGGGKRFRGKTGWEGRFGGKRLWTVARNGLSMTGLLVP
jgi:hypothetical protein